MVLLQRASMVRLRTCTATTNAVTLHWATSRNKTTSTLIVVCCLSVIDTLCCLLPVMVMVIYNCHQNEINSHSCDFVCANNHTTQSLIFFVCFGTCRATVGVVGVQLLVVVLLCTLFVLLRKRQASLVANANEEKHRSVGRLDSVGACVVVFLVSGLESLRNFDGRRSTITSLASWRLCSSEPKRRRCRARACEAMAVFCLFFLCGARCCTLVWWRAVDGVCALLGAVCVTRRCVRDSTLEALGAVCAART